MLSADLEEDSSPAICWREGVKLSFSSFPALHAREGGTCTLSSIRLRRINYNLPAGVRGVELLKPVVANREVEYDIDGYK